MTKNKNDQNDDLNNEFDQPEVERGLSSVASLPAKNMMVIVVFLGVIGFMLYNFFFSSDSNTEVEQNKPIIPVSEPVKPPVDIVDSMVPELPSEDSISVPPAPPVLNPIVVDNTPPALPSIPTSQPEPIPMPPLPGLPAQEPVIVPPSVAVSNQPTVDPKLEARRKSSIMITGAATNEETRKASEAERLKNQIVTDFIPEKTASEQVRASKIGDMSSTIAQGKIIDAILETAITTDLQGLIRAVVSRDVYAESGKAVMIPKGSRLIGNYSAEIARGQNRVLISWNRIIRPDGIDIMVDSPGTDQIGRAGVTGFVDNKYMEILTNAVLISAVNFAIAYQAESYATKKLDMDFAGAGNTTETEVQDPTDPSKTVRTTTKPTESPASKAFRDSTDNISGTTKQIIQGSLDDRPTITIDQGTRIKVFVRKDILFPKKYSNAVKIVK